MDLGMHFGGLKHTYGTGEGTAGEDSDLELAGISLMMKTYLLLGTFLRIEESKTPA
jgi:hypothetical protein